VGFKKNENNRDTSTRLQIFSDSCIKRRPEFVDSIALQRRTNSDVVFMVVTYSLMVFRGVIFFLIRQVGRGVQLGPLGTAATNWPIVPAPG
jgi:hypothetical protein